MPQATKAMDSDHIASPGAAMLEGPECGPARAKQWRTLNTIKIFRNAYQRFFSCCHIFCISAISAYACCYWIFTAQKISKQTFPALETMAAMPTNAHPIPCFPLIDFTSNDCNFADRFMPRYSRIGKTVKVTFFDNCFSTANAACFNLYQYFIWQRDRHLSVYKLKRPSWFAYLYCAHQISLDHKRIQKTDACLIQINIALLIIDAKPSQGHGYRIQIVLY